MLWRQELDCGCLDARLRLAIMRCVFSLGALRGLPWTTVPVNARVRHQRDKYHLLLEYGATAAIRSSFADVVPPDGLPAERMVVHAAACAQRASAPDHEPDNEDKSHCTAVRRRSQFVHECMLIADAKPA
jgi:hypothetical protein